MTDREARALGRAIVSTTQGIRVAFGRTNGRVCLHLLGSREDFGQAWSDTIYSQAEWDEHQYNKTAKRRHRADSAWNGLNDFIASQEVPAA